MLKIRLKQTGAKNQRNYRIVAIEEFKRRDGREVEILGYFNKSFNPVKVELKRDRIDYWISKGAQLTESVKKLLSQK